ncbi:Mitochondrial import inner membrane translocase subunit tim54 [Cytospora mali]|uniref:Mitochondrial import inner membrane translocase subunit TIM54 n=1 Tax=Cytospora mali TaxID=578113 RepID=A0A194VWA1_CYTMA|nr:Mitochondrial import inner membrane translocase subunit tim54 [Valsa mali]
MAEPTNPPAAPAAPAPAAAKPPAPAAPKQNPALRMMGLPALPRKLPSRNWMIFWTLSTTLAAAIIYDRREKRRATARWAHSVEHLATRPLPNPSAMPRKLTIYLEAPPGDGLRAAQDHYTEYVKPVLAASGLDWEFVQGRQQGDIRAAVAEKVRRKRRAQEKDIGGAEQEEVQLPTEEDRLEAFRRAHGIPEYDGVRGDVVIGRHAWKEYIRGLHEGWLGPLKAPAHAQPDPEPKPTTEEGGEEAEQKPKRPPQIKPYNSPEDYATAHLPLLIPSELAPSAPISFPHILGFLNTPTRFYRFLTRRRLADDIGREVAAACLCTYREYQEEAGADASPDYQWEQQKALVNEEKNWVKSVWKDDEETKKKEEVDASPTAPGSEAVDGSKSTTVRKEKIWPKPVVMDPRLAMRMRRFELQPEDEQRAREIVVAEEEIEGFIKGTFRSLWRWSAKQFQKEERKVPMSFDDE